MKEQKKSEFGVFGNSIIQLVLIFYAFFQFLPFIWLIYSSFKTSIEIRNDVLAFPKSLYLGNYNFSFFSTKGILFGTYFKNSAIVIIVTLLVSTIISFIAAYAIAKLNFPGKNIILFIIIAMMGIPAHIVILPLYFYISKLGLLNNYFGLILPYIAFNCPLAVVILQAYFRQFPDEIIEAAKIDGCSNVRTFFSVVMPISMGAVSSVLIINFINIWNEFLISLVIMRDNSAKTLPVGLLGFKGIHTVDWGPMLAGIIISLIPIFIWYLIFHRNIIKGMVTGAVKE
jgi:raffinose/stachyose/melibiose transport system permease protein